MSDDIDRRFLTGQQHTSVADQLNAVVLSLLADGTRSIKRGDVAKRMLMPQHIASSYYDSLDGLLRVAATKRFAEFSQAMNEFGQDNAPDVSLMHLIGALFSEGVRPLITAALYYDGVITIEGEDVQSKLTVVLRNALIRVNPTARANAQEVADFYIGGIMIAAFRNRKAAASTKAFTIDQLLCAIRS